jgi:putative hydrolase of the HAD superfamily
MIKALIFDWHGVLDSVEFEGLAKLLAEITDATPVDVHEKLRDIERQYARGDIEPELFWGELGARLNITDSQLEEARSYIVSTNLKQDVWQLIPSLSKKYKLAILSDCPKDKANFIRDSANLELFEAAHFSADEHLLKSDPIFFENIIHELGLGPEDCLFIDDREKNLTLPRELGVGVHLFNGDLAVFEALLV